MADTSFLDWPFLDDHHRTLARELDAWAAEHIAPLADDHDDVDAACARLVRLLGEAGWLQYCIPASHGGKFETMDVRSLYLIRETLARHSGLADFVFALQGLGSGVISNFGSDALKAKYLPKVASGEMVAAFALTELDSGSDVAATASTAEDRGDHFVVNGAKTYISNGGIADFYVTVRLTI